MPRSKEDEVAVGGAVGRMSANEIGNDSVLRIRRWTGRGRGAQPWRTRAVLTVFEQLGRHVADVCKTLGP
jgi:hypothetical protein